MVGVKRMGAKQKSIVRYLVHRRELTMFPPSTKEIAEACFMSKSTVVSSLPLLEALGYVRLHYGDRNFYRLAPRGIEVLKDADKRLDIPPATNRQLMNIREQVNRLAGSPV